MPTNAAEYWAQRRQALLAQMEADEAKLNERLAELYASEAAKLEREIASYYQRFGEGNVIEYRKLLASLGEADRVLLIERMDEFARRYPQWAHLMPVRETIYKLNELEAVQTSIRLQQLEIGAIEQSELEAHLRQQAQRSANLAAERMGFGTSFYNVNADVVKSVVGRAWADGKAYSERVWANREKLAAYLNDDFGKLIARGVPYEQCVKELQERFDGVSKRDIHRLVFTEGSFVFAEASAQVFEREFGEYLVVTAGDGRVCGICSEIAANVAAHPVRYADRQAGANFPPFHPWCRCDTVPNVTDWDSWIEEQTAKRRRPLEPVRSGRLHSMSVDEVAAQVIALERALNASWNAYRKWKTPGNYENTMGAFLDGYSGKGFITAEQGVKPEGKELQVAAWIAGSGHDVRFLFASSKKGSRTPDLLIDGEPWEMKRISSSDPRKIKKRTVEAKRQSGSVIVDLSLSEITADKAREAIGQVFDDPQINRIALIKGGFVEEFKK